MGLRRGGDRTGVLLTWRHPIDERFSLRECTLVFLAPTEIPEETDAVLSGPRFVDGVTGGPRRRDPSGRDAERFLVEPHHPCRPACDREQFEIVGRLPECVGGEPERLEGRAHLHRVAGASAPELHHRLPPARARGVVRQRDEIGACGFLKRDEGGLVEAAPLAPEEGLFDGVAYERVPEREHVGRGFDEQAATHQIA